MIDNVLTQQLVTMLRLQDEINSKINPNWRTANNPWHRAIWTECAELLEHIGWKWWKAQTPDIQQVQLEVVDIWHFGLSDILTAHADHQLAAQRLEQTLHQLSSLTSFQQFDAQAALEIVERFAESTLSRRKFDPALFAELAQIAGLSMNALFQQYVGKNILNRFRQDHGYKQGTYVKVWQGKEDNVWLSEITQTIDSTAPDYAEIVYSKLVEHYQKYTLAT